MVRYDDRSRRRGTRRDDDARGDLDPEREEHGLEVLGHRHAADLEVSHDALPYVEPDQFGIRTSWQSESERIEAAEFLVATRIQEDTRRRTSRELDELRQREHPDEVGEDVALDLRDWVTADGPVDD